MANRQMKRIIAHWTGGAGRASDLDMKHYHRLTEFDGTQVNGSEEIEDNIVTSDGDYAAHTLQLNTGSIGVAMCGMRDAMEYPFSPGPSPINEVQFDAFCSMIARLSIEYGIPVTPQTVLTHAEVQPTLGVRQRAKWDITRLPWKPDIRGARAVGDYMRRRIVLMQGGEEVIQTNRPTLRFGDRGADVAVWQSDLADLGYFSGRNDGSFGQLTRAATLAFQADQDLATDGVVGPMTWQAANSAEPRPAREVTQEEIDAESGTARDALMTARVGDLVGLGGVAGLATQASEAAEAASGVLETLSGLVPEHWPALLLCGGCVLAWVLLRSLGHTTRKRRLRDAREHRSLAR
ncbi:peptidoglycan-binding domain-containing protein [uncultured Tateyamaria sp.]|uniref:peptidoglycan recognition protein family protein n=1 Tax=uncultured Tateyamaria sp. TaxID=455651 RepID=UPI0026106727|nr:peptidoglycan-binding domain-containing protein [uncultured Tateyamaria sp.]